MHASAGDETREPTTMTDTRLSGTDGTTAGGLAGALAIEERPAEMLLTGCASLGLLVKNDGRYVNSPLAEEFLVPGKPYSFGGWVQMLDQRRYLAWGRLAEAVRTNRPTTWDPDRQSSMFDGEDPRLLAVFWEAMHSLSTFTARVLGQAIDLSGARRLLDVGGGSAAFDIELCKLYPNLTAAVHELPKVADIAAGKVRMRAVAFRSGSRHRRCFAAQRDPPTRLHRQRPTRAPICAPLPHHHRRATRTACRPEDPPRRTMDHDRPGQPRRRRPDQARRDQPT
jgi:O-methyltransferase